MKNTIFFVFFSFFFIACSSNQQEKVITTDAISFEGVNIDVNYNVFNENLKKNGYEKVNLPSEVRDLLDYDVFYGNVANNEATINVYQDSISQKVKYIKSLILCNSEEESLVKLNNVINYFKERYPNAQYSEQEDDGIKYRFFTSPILVTVSEPNMNGNQYVIHIDYDNMGLYE